MKRRRAKKVILLSLLGLLAFIGFFVMATPANVVWQVAKERSLIPGNIQVSGIEGTLWKGSARKVTIDEQVLPKTGWALSGDSLFAQKLMVDVQIGHARSDLFAKAQLGWDGEQLSVVNARGRVNRDQIQEWVQLPFPIVVNGQLSVAIPNMIFKQGRCIVLDGDGALRQAEVQTPFGEVDLGQVSFDLSCKSNRLTIAISQNSSELKVSAKVVVDMNGRYTLNGNLLPQDELAEPFWQSLSLLGRANASGEYPLKTSGAL